MDRPSLAWGVLLAVSIALLAGGALDAIGTTTPLLVVGVFGLIAGVLGLTSGHADDADDVWDAIPKWQYDGRHVESGGFTRAEQEEAIEEIDERASEQLDELDDH